MVRRTIPPAPYKCPIAIPPGETIKRIIIARNITQNELATRMGRPKQEISYLINGKRTITLETAKQLEYVLGIKASFWLNIERDYQETKARLEEEERLSQQVEKVKNFPYPEMVRLGLVGATRKSLEKAENLLKFFEVVSFDALEAHVINIAGDNLFRKSEKFDLSLYKLAVWLRMGEFEASELELKGFNTQRLKRYLPDIRSLTLKEPKYFVPVLEKIGSECGVAFLFIREFKGFPVWGSTRWVGNNPYIQVNLRYKTNDHLWFSIFHEIGHLLLHKKGDFFINIKNRSEDNNYEIEADDFARDTLISMNVYNRLINSSYITEKMIIDTAKEIGIAPGIIVGRLQHDKKIQHHQFNEFKETYEWVK
ncbi:MAG: ImmA/IrrE family metallo-endopeptidase [candidate division Zixibacteria bacterium]|nr:ImmA/IrrE family metallo-endopeptidase [Candidatus Tariuqbacter arcticus]